MLKLIETFRALLSTMFQIIRNTSNGEQMFGPAFHKEFLLKFKSMQDDILKVSFAFGKIMFRRFLPNMLIVEILQLGGSQDGLQNICVAPLVDAGVKMKNTRKCLVLSVWGYFKNNMRIFERVEKKLDGYVADYLDQIKICSQLVHYSF